MNASKTQYKKNDDGASIGIGAMIVFIALILVAAVASTIIIKTAEELQQRAEATGDDTRDEISGKVTIISAHVDTIDGVTSTVDQVVVIAQMSAGSDSVVADDISWLVICDAGASAGFDTSDIVNGGSTTLANAGTATQIATGDIINSGDTFTFDMPLVNCAPGVNAEIEVRIIIDGGGETYAQMQVTDLTEGAPLV